MGTGQTTEDKKVIYEERSGFGLWFKLLMYPLVVLYAVVFAGSLALGNYGIAIPFAAVLIVFILMVTVFARLSFSVTNVEVSFGYGIFGKKFLLSDVNECKPFDVRFSNYHGYGIRYGRDGSVAYITHSGPGVKIDIKGAKRPFVVSVEHPEKICKIIKESMKTSLGIDSA